VSAPLVDLFGEVLREIRDDTAIKALTNGYVWNEVPDLWNGVPLPTDARPYILLKDLTTARMERAPIQTGRFMVISVGKSPRLAKQLYGLVSAVLHIQGPRVNSGVGIYLSKEEVGGQPGVDPQTHYPTSTAIYEVFADTGVFALA
jgi:hypothetical protein